MGELRWRCHHRVGRRFWAEDLHGRPQCAQPPSSTDVQDIALAFTLTLLPYHEWEHISASPPSPHTDGAFPQCGAERGGGQILHDLATPLRMRGGMNMEHRSCHACLAVCVGVLLMRGGDEYGAQVMSCLPGCLCWCFVVFFLLLFFSF